MITLQGKNLCERQKELNFKVIEAAQNKVDFQEVKSAKESSDVDRLFKIDLASKYRNIDYLIEELKCGDSLYISRVLKCDWIYDNEYAHIMNPDYLHHNIFPTMSLKMKSKTLSNISIYVRDETRAQLFYEYCRNTQMQNNSHKFLIFTSESYILDFLNNEDNFGHGKYIEDFKNLIGNSFVLADIFAKQRGQISDLPHLYSVNEVDYLNLLEKYYDTNEYSFRYTPFGSKMSRSILKKHKTRMLKNPGPYLKVLKTSELIKYSSSDDARVYATSLLPEDVAKFWRADYCKTFRHILDLIKPDMYEFMKQIFSKKYPKQEFELSKNFYRLNYYSLMNAKEKETWALTHLDKHTGVIPEDEDYQWYEFVEFPQAFEKIKKKILITTNAEKRTSMLIILVKSAKTQRELEELLNHYYKRHVNDRKDLKEKFLENVIENHEVFHFDDVSWGAFDKLLHSAGIYISDSWRTETFRAVSLVYHIINKRTLPDGLLVYLNKIQLHAIKRCSENLCQEKRDFVYEYMFQFMISKIQGFESLDYNDSVRDQVRDYLKKLIELKRTFKKEGDYPEIALKYMNLDLDHFDHIINKKMKSETKETAITEGFLLRCLKRDPNVILENFSLIEKQCNELINDYLRLNMLLKKIKIYFYNDFAKQYLDLCIKSLSNAFTGQKDHRCIFITRAISQNVYTIFILGDERMKTEFMDKHAPVSAKIEHDKIDGYLLCVQEAICRFHCYSRPPVPLSKTIQYLKGDYVHMCKDMFNMYLANLTPLLLTEFISFLVDSPISIQKRGLPLAFRSFKTSELKNLVSNAWRKTKNVSVRSNLYKLTLEKVRTVTESQMEFFELLKELTKDIHQDDENEVFECFSCRQIPDQLMPSYLETAWKTVIALPEKKTIIQRRTNVVNKIESNIISMNEAFLESLVDSHIQKRLMEEKLSPESNSDTAELNKALWDLVGKYIITIPTELKQEKSLNVVKAIVKECFDNWTETHNTNEFVYQQFFKEMASYIDNESSYYGPRYSRVTKIFEYLLESFETQFGVKEMYSYYWDWKLSLIARTVINAKERCDKDAFISFGSELGKFVKGLKERQCYYTSFLRKFLGKISKFTGILTELKTDLMSDNYVKILIAYGLTQYKMLETYVLALEILPQNLTVSAENEPELQEVIKAVRTQNNDELTAFMNDKFIYTDLKVRKIWL